MKTIACSTAIVVPAISWSSRWDHPQTVGLAS